MNITVAKTAGFCYGVKRAVDAVYDLIGRGGDKKIATLGQLIHNRQVVEDLKQHGVIVYENIEDVDNDVHLIIRAHGISKKTLDIIKNKGIEFDDLTCPFVSKIHSIVEKYHNDGYRIVIVGDAQHPEVKGINGWCDDSAVITNDENENIFVEIAQKKLCIVAQTTTNREKFEKILENAKNTCQEVVFFDTICLATRRRQTETAELAKKSDIMIVIGGKESSNTKKLYEISKAICPQTYHIEIYEELPQLNLKNKNIGVTAGASTPSRIIKGVHLQMEENFEQLLEESLKPLNNGDIVTGTVSKVGNTEVMVDLKAKSEGILKLEDLTDDPTKKPSDIVKEGDEIEVYVVGVNDGEGKIVLSKKKVDQMAGWKKLKEAYEAGEVLEGKVINAVKGGVIVLTENTRVFIPARQVSERFIQDLNTLVGNTVNYKIIDIEEKRSRLVGSVRVVLEEKRKAVEEKFWADAEVSKVYNGTVKSLTDFGAFVDIGGVDGLVHISELSWNKIKHPSEVVKVGDTVEVYIKSLDPEKKKISLGYKKQEDNPWTIAQSKYKVGDVISCKIVRMMSFGAFAEIMPSIDGLIHISQIANERIEKPSDVLTIGQVVDAKITDIKWEDKKISLSIRALLTANDNKESKETATEE